MKSCLCTSNVTNRRVVHQKPHLSVGEGRVGLSDVAVYGSRCAGPSALGEFRVSRDSKRQLRDFEPVVGHSAHDMNQVIESNWLEDDSIGSQVVGTEDVFLSPGGCQYDHQIGRAH